jgi:hypothetical protein
VTGTHLLGGEQFDDPVAERVGKEPEEGSALAADVDGGGRHVPIRSHQWMFISG